VAESTCVRCGSSEFEEVLKPDIRGADKAISFVQCANCGGVVAAKGFLDVEHMIVHLSGAVREIARKRELDVEL
jgi:uncharacterized Zn finger protein